jgi:acyl-CoA thioesterase YciA
VTQARFIFVAIDESRQPRAVPPIPVGENAHG